MDYSLNLKYFHPCLNSEDRILKSIVLIVFLLVTPALAMAQSSAFTFQGKLKDNNSAATGTYDIQFSLFDAVSGGIQIGSTITFDGNGANPAPVQASNGIFTVQLDFAIPNAFDGGPRWLEMAVKRPADTSFITLTPRQPLTSSPYAIKSFNSAIADSLSNACLLCITDAHIQSVDGSKVTGTIANASNADTANSVIGVVQIANGGTGSSTKSFVDLSTDQTNIGGNKTFTGTLTGNGSGLTNVAGTLKWQTVSGLSQQAQAGTGYLLNNASQVTVTLPTSPSVGDVIRVSGMGLGGWKIAQNAGQSIIGTNIDVVPYASWTPRGLFPRPWTSVASSADGSKLVAVADNDQIYTSADAGVTWTPRNSNRNWTSVASSADGSKLVAVVNGGQIYTSTNSGVNWTPRDSNRGWASVASSADGGKLVAVADAIYTSTDSGVTWTIQGDIPLSSLQSVASSADGSKLVACGDTIYTSTDSGVTWTRIPNQFSGLLQSVASSADGNKLVAVIRNGKIYTSTDSGATWTPRESNRQWMSVASSADGSKLVAVVGGGKIYVSVDSGATWVPRDSNRGWASVSSSADGSKLVADADLIYTSAPTTPQGTAGFITGGQYSAIELQYVGSGQFLPVSFAGSITGL